MGNFGFIAFRSVRCREDIEKEMRRGYNYGFKIYLLPTIEIHNAEDAVGVRVVWLTKEFVWYYLKEISYYVDIQGREHYEYHGIRYLLSLKWLFKY